MHQPDDQAQRLWLPRPLKAGPGSEWGATLGMAPECRDRSWPLAAVEDACRQVGIDHTGRKVIRVGQCASVALPFRGLLARVGRQSVPSEGLDAEMRFARVASSAGLDVLTPADAVASTAVATRHGPVSFWPLLRRDSRARLDWTWLGETLRVLHDLPSEGLLSQWDPLGRVEVRLNTYEGFVDARPEYLICLRDALASAREALSAPTPLGVGLLHGDATPGNVFLSTRGPLLIDFDLAGVGPREWDLTAIAVLRRRFGLAERETRSFYEAYGFDMRSWGNAGAVIRARELLDISLALARSAYSLVAARELDVRMSTWSEKTSARRWTRL